ncbi:MAG TPA: HD domain-containing phosphohydrolase [Thermoanaerobaculia bacterium]|nr:HD domain-containing phosphohydrolase [Thermoanaerobaculia bacterium]
MSPLRPVRFRLRNLLFLVLLLSGIIPLAVASYLLVRQNRQVLEDQERALLVTEAQSLSQEVSGYLEGVRKQLAQTGRGLLLAGDPATGARAISFEEPWVTAYLEGLGAENPGRLMGWRVLDGRGNTRSAIVEVLQGAAEEPLQRVASEAFASGRPAYGFAVLEPVGPVAAVAVPAARPGGEVALVVEALVRLAGLGPLFEREAMSDEVLGTALLGADGSVLWWRGIPPAQRQALARSYPVLGFVKQPMAVLGQYGAPGADGRTQEMLVRISPVTETGWGLVAQKPLATAFAAVDAMMWNALAASLLLVLLSSFFALYAARKVSEPVQRLAESSHEIVAGNFGRRVEAGGLTVELTDLADDFNRMSGHVERSIEDLRRAAQANRELFIGSLRAFAAAIDAKDPYTRGHSERVAALSRTIARHLGLPEEIQHRVWIAALLHDVGKIGVDDEVLKKSGGLTSEEFDAMKAHTVIGAEILSPIEQLREMIPAVRWHHENWNGKGYPDGLKGEQIPLLARVVAVADTFDAVTTNRPYQHAFSLEDAVGTIRRLVGSRFDAKVVTAFFRAYEKGEVRVPPQRPAGPRPVAAARVAARA